MPQAETAAAPAPVTPSTFRNRRRLMASLISVVTYAAIARHFAFDVTADAPPHAERGYLIDLRHSPHVAVTVQTRLGAERFDVPHVRKTNESREGVNARPLRRFALARAGAQLLYLLAFGARRRRVCFHAGPRASRDVQVAPHAGLQRRYAGLTRDSDRVVAIHAGDLVVPGMHVVSKEDRLAGTLQAAAISDDRCLGTLGSSWGLQAVHDRRREGKHQHHDRS